MSGASAAMQVQSDSGASLGMQRTKIASSLARLSPEQERMDHAVSDD